MALSLVKYYFERFKDNKNKNKNIFRILIYSVFLVIVFKKLVFNINHQYCVIKFFILSYLKMKNPVKNVSLNYRKLVLKIN
jgi:hypothetical protein